MRSDSSDSSPRAVLVPSVRLDSLIVPTPPLPRFPCGDSMSYRGEWRVVSTSCERPRVSSGGLGPVGERKIAFSHPDSIQTSLSGSDVQQLLAVDARLLARFKALEGQQPGALFVVSSGKPVVLS